MKDKTKGISILIILGIIYGYVMSILLSLGSSQNDKIMRFIIIMTLVVIAPAVIRWVANKLLNQNRLLAGFTMLFTGVLATLLFNYVG